jgi:hypothetical protein
MMMCGIVLTVGGDMRVGGLAFPTRKNIIPPLPHHLYIRVTVALLSSDGTYIKGDGLFSFFYHFFEKKILLHRPLQPILFVYIFLPPGLFFFFFFLNVA